MYKFLLFLAVLVGLTGSSTVYPIGDFNQNKLGYGFGAVGVGLAAWGVFDMGIFSISHHLHRNRQSADEMERAGTRNCHKNLDFYATYVGIGKFLGGVALGYASYQNKLSSFGLGASSIALVCWGYRDLLRISMQSNPFNKMAAKDVWNKETVITTAKFLGALGLGYASYKTWTSKS